MFQSVNMIPQHLFLLFFIKVQINHWSKCNIVQWRKWLPTTIQSHCKVQHSIIPILLLQLYREGTTSGSNPLQKRLPQSGKQVCFHPYAQQCDKHLLVPSSSKCNFESFQVNRADDAKRRNHLSKRNEIFFQIQ